MAVKISGVDLSANTTANIGQAGSSGGTYTVHILNRSSSTAFVQLGVGDSSAPLLTLKSYWRTLRLLQMKV